jgi:hypothetical protein
MPTKLSSTNSSKDSGTNTQPVTGILSEISLAAATIIDQTKLIAKLFDGAQNRLPYDVRTAIATLPSLAMAGDQLLSLERVAQRWNTRVYTVHKRLVNAGANVIVFERQYYIRLSNLLAIEERSVDRSSNTPAGYRKAKAVSAALRAWLASEPINQTTKKGSRRMNSATSSRYQRQ